MILRVLLWTAIAAVIAVAANWATWRSIQAPPLPSPALAVSAAALPWQPFATIAGDETAVRFPDALRARDGQPVEMVGVLYPVTQLIENGRLAGAVLAPPAKFSCCGLSCEARSLSLVFIAPAAPIADPGRKRLARVAGILRLHPEPGTWSPTEIADARVEFLPDP